MFQSLLYAVKRRLIYEIEDAFQNHPAFSNNEKVKVYHKFPYVERVQYGVVLRNASSSMMRMSPDNFLTDLESHVRLVREPNYPGLSIEWVRENLCNVTDFMVNEDVSSQLGSTQRMFRTSNQILSGPGNTKYADNVGQIEVRVNGTKQLAEYVNGEKGVVMLRQAPGDGTDVRVSYYYRKIVPPGIYVIDFTEDNEFLVQPIYIVKAEEIIENTTGTEVTASLDNQNVYPGTDFFSIRYRTSTTPIHLVRGTDYTINYTTGAITFLQPLPKNYIFYGDYRWQPTNYVNGPHTVNSYQENHTALSGIVLAVGRRAKKGDRQAVVVSKFREPQARIYGGHWTMTLDLSVIAKDSIQMEEMAEQVINWLWSVRKNTLEFEGITLNSVEPTGESEESYVETTGDVYYTTSIAVNVQTEWQKFVPYLFEIREIIPNIEEWPGVKDYEVSNNYDITLKTFQADTRPVLKYPVIGYERPA